MPSPSALGRSCVGGFEEGRNAKSSSEISAKRTQQKKLKDSVEQRKQASVEKDGKDKTASMKRDSSAAPSVSFQEAPWKVVDVHTPENLAVLYRLSGDWNPLHVSLHPEEEEEENGN